jgi:hypothetical protein
MPNVVVVKNFASIEECNKLNEWVEQGILNKWLDLGLSRGERGYEKRLTSRMYGERYENTETALKIQERICKLFELDQYEKAELSGGKDGIVVSCTFNGGDVYAHLDPRFKAPLSTLRCNLLSSAAEQGCDLYINGSKVDVEEGDLVCYLVTDFVHRVTDNLGDKPRILWMFGWYLPKDKWENNNGRH